MLSLRGIEKSFGGIRALRRGDLEITGPGIGHALIGANGSGKSTLLSVLSGQTAPDGGVIELDGEVLSFPNPLSALQCGIAMVAQETAVAPDLTVAENIFLGHRMRRGRLGIDWSSTEAAADVAMRNLGVDIDVTRRVGELRPDQQQIVEIARALSMDVKVLILDEPTSSLTDDEVASVSAAIQRVKAIGVAVILVSHRFEEAFSLCEEMTVLRDGETVATGSLVDQDPDSLVELMVGRSGRERAAVAEVVAPLEGATPALELRDGSSGRAFSGIELSVFPGEVVGLAGLVGSGRSELLEAIFGGRPLSGELRVGGKLVAARSPRRLIDHGVGYVPPDRKRQGLVLSGSIAENLNMVVGLRSSRWRRPRPGSRTRLAAEVGTRLGIRYASADAPVSELSGGNQQKVSLGKWLAAGSDVLLLDEPTRGVDVGAKVEIHAALVAIARSGTAMLVSSSETSELLTVCDRVLVMVRGRIVADLPREGLTEDVLASHTGGHL